MHLEKKNYLWASQYSLNLAGFWCRLQHGDITRDHIAVMACCGYSDDNGKSWNVSVISNNTHYYESLKGLGRAGDQLIALVRTHYGGGTARFYYTNDNGENWLKHNEGYELKDIGDMVLSDVFWGSDGYTYLLYNGPDDILHFNLYRHDSSVPIDFTGQKPYEVGEIGSGATWEGPLLPFLIGDDSHERLWITDEGRIAVWGTSHYGGGSASMPLRR